MVYPAESPVFQQGVVALAEFLQWHGGCNVAVDLWQQGQIAKLGPLRWLTEQVKAADFVLIIRPQAKTVSRLRKIHMCSWTALYPRPGSVVFTPSVIYCMNQDNFTLYLI